MARIEAHANVAKENPTHGPPVRHGLRQTLNKAKLREQSEKWKSTIILLLSLHWDSHFSPARVWKALNLWDLESRATPHRSGPGSSVPQSDTVPLWTAPPASCLRFLVSVFWFLVPGCAIL